MKLDLGALSVVLNQSTETSGPLSGATFVVKENIDVAAHVSTNGHPKWAQTHAAAERNAPVVDRLLGAGAHLVGKTNMDEMAYSLLGANPHYGTPINPAAQDRHPGGSSSGSAVAVAAGTREFRHRHRHRRLLPRAGRLLRNLRLSRFTRRCVDGGDHSACAVLRRHRLVRPRHRRLGVGRRSIVAGRRKGRGRRRSRAAHRRLLRSRNGFRLGGGAADRRLEGVRPLARSDARRRFLQVGARAFPQHAGLRGLGRRWRLDHRRTAPPSAKASKSVLPSRPRSPPTKRQPPKRSATKSGQGLTRCSARAASSSCPRRRFARRC